MKKTTGVDVEKGKHLFTAGAVQTGIAPIEIIVEFPQNYGNPSATESRFIHF